MSTETRSFLDRLLSEGMRMAQQSGLTGGRSLDDPAMKAKLRETGLPAGAAIGVAAMLLGGRRRNSFSRNALLAAGAGALGKIAMDAWQKHQAQQQGQGGGTAGLLGADRPIDQLGEDESETRARTLLFAMVAAAKADGHIDEAEHSAIEAEMDDLPASVKGLMGEAIARPADPEGVAAMVKGGVEAREVYAASALLCGRDHPQEVDYLDRLARALGIDDREAREIEGEVLSVA